MIHEELECNTLLLFLFQGLPFRGFWDDQGSPKHIKKADLLS